MSLPSGYRIGSEGINRVFRETHNERLLQPWHDVHSQQAFDPYTFTHILHGFAFIAFAHLVAPRICEIWKLVAALSLEAVWEVIENTNFIIERYRSETMALGYIGDTILNSFGDVLACALGAIVARQIGVLKTLVPVVLIEGGLLLTVRDNLSLNILMLFYPIEAIKHWQPGQAKLAVCIELRDRVHSCRGILAGSDLADFRITRTLMTKPDRFERRCESDRSSL